MTDNLTDLSARAEALSTDVATARRERDSLRTELATCRAERDRLRLRLETDQDRHQRELEAERDRLRHELESERDRFQRELDADRDRHRHELDTERARFAAAVETVSIESTHNAQRAAIAERAAEQLAGELTATRATLSWRITRPLRAIRRTVRRG